MPTKHNRPLTRTWGALNAGAVFLIMLTLTLRADGTGRTSGRGEGGWVGAPCGGVAEHKTFHSQAVGGEVSYHVLLPRDYNDGSGRRYPVIYWLHGTGGGCRGVETVANHYRGMMEAGEMPESIVVFPNGLPRGMWCDSLDGSQRPESMVVRDLVPHIDGTYRTKNSRGARAIEGFSMGGYGAGRIGFKHGESFGHITMYGAGPLHTNFLERDPNLQPLGARARVFREVYGNDPDYYIENLPQSQALKVLESSHLRGTPELRIIVGQDDPLRSNNKALSVLLSKKLGVEHSYVEVSGVGHDIAALLEATRDDTGEFYRNNFR